MRALSGPGLVLMHGFEATHISSFCPTGDSLVFVHVCLTLKSWMDYLGKLSCPEKAALWPNGTKVSTTSLKAVPDNGKLAAEAPAGLAVILTCNGKTYLLGHAFRCYPGNM